MRVSFSRASARRCENRRVVEAVGNALFGQPLLAGDLLLLPGDVAGVLDVVTDLLGDLARTCRPVPAAAPPGRPKSLPGGRSNLASVVAIAARCVRSNCSTRCDLRFLALQAAPAPLVHQATGPAERRQPAVGVVVPQQQAVFGPAGEHAIRLVDAAGHQVVDQHADVRLLAVEHERLGCRAACSAALTPAISPWAAASS